MQPVPPAVQRDGDIKPLQQGIGIQTRTPENHDIEDVVGDSGGPIPDVFLDLQPNADRTSDEAEQFRPSHAARSRLALAFGMSRETACCVSTKGLQVPSKSTPYLPNFVATFCLWNMPVGPKTKPLIISNLPS